MVINGTCPDKMEMSGILDRIMDVKTDLGATWKN